MRHYSQDRDVLKNLPEGGDGWSTNATLWKCSTRFQVVMHPKSHLCVEKDCQPNVDALRIESQSKVPPPPVTDASFLWLFFFYVSAESETETPRKRRGAVWNSKKRNGSKQKGPGRKEKKGQTRIKQTNPGRDRVQKSKYTNWRGMNTQKHKGKREAHRQYIALLLQDHPLRLSPYSEQSVVVQSVTRLPSWRLRVKCSTGCFWRGTTAA